MNEGIYKAKYVGKPVMGFVPGRIYQISVEKRNYVYNVEAIDAEGTGLLQYANEISIRQRWKDICEVKM